MPEIKIHASQIEMLPVEALRGYDNNARTHPDGQIKALADIIREHGFTNPVLVDDDDVIIAGHGRCLAARRLKMAEVPCVRVSGLTEAQIKALRISDNQTGLLSGWDEALLRVELSELRDAGFDLGLTGFASLDIDKLFERGREYQRDPDDAPEVDPVAYSRRGDTWLMGTHRLAVGDSTVLADVQRAMGGSEADCLWTDPPYNLNYEGTAGKIANDHMKAAEFRAFLKDAFASALAVMKRGAPAYIAHADTEGLNFRAAFAETGFKISGCLIWRKNALVLGRSDYQWQHEPILYGWKPGAAHRWYGGRKAVTVQDLGGDLITDNGDGTFTLRLGGEAAILTGENMAVEWVQSTVLDVEKPKRSAEHPTMKPVELITRMLLNSTREADVVLDLFGGSGSTLIACEMRGRSCRMVEYDPRFADVIVRRWEEFTGRTATLAETGETFEQVRAARLEVV